MMVMMMTSNELISKFVKYSTMQLAGHQWLSALLVLKFKLLQAPKDSLVFAFRFATTHRKRCLYGLPEYVVI